MWHERLLVTPPVASYPRHRALTMHRLLHASSAPLLRLCTQPARRHVLHHVAARVRDPIDRLISIALDKLALSILPELARHAGRGDGSATVMSQQTALRTRHGEKHPVVLALSLEPALVAARRGAGRGMYTAGSACRA